MIKKRFDFELDMNITDNLLDKEYDLHNGDEALEFIDQINKMADENQFLKNSETILNQKELQCLIYQTIINRYKAKIRDEESLLEYYEKTNYSHATIDRQRIRINTLEVLTNELIDIQNGIKKNIGSEDND